MEMHVIADYGSGLTESWEDTGNFSTTFDTDHLYSPLLVMVSMNDGTSAQYMS
jgi:hypothetical protein